ncbi:segregation/condensation protein A [Aquifex aeolicus]|uniref:Segregation and condensation protein A n=1 Tax=Aquifex aeolicus (strain VF5) TaxID=224324 RepID=O66739_AQUAE|nr:ScpA family protein [Aquifex aeolicus]AAC06703.1 hypothetical protein aq_423 [Aquifex aeolicus VF5]
MKYFHFTEEHPFSLVLPLIEEGKLDPWEVDIVELANLYMEELKKLEVLDLRVPARAILAASFLLRKKIETIFPKPPRKYTKRKYTLQEIVDMFEEEYREVEEDIKENVEKIRKIVKRKRASAKRKRREKRKEVPLHVAKFEEVLEELWNSFKELEVGTRLSFFNFLSKKDLVPQFMALLYLDYESKVRLFQEKPFEDITVEILKT